MVQINYSIYPVCFRHCNAFLLSRHLAGQPVGCFSFDNGVTSCEISADGDCAVACVPGCDEIVTLYPPGGAQQDDLDERRRCVYGDASKCGETFDVSTSS